MAIFRAAALPAAGIVIAAAAFLAAREAPSILFDAPAPAASYDRQASTLGTWAVSSIGRRTLTERPRRRPDATPSNADVKKAIFAAAIFGSANARKTPNMRLQAISVE